MSKKKNGGSNLGPRKPYFEQGPVNFGSQSAATTAAISTHGSISHRRQVRQVMSTTYDPSEGGEDKDSMASAYTYRSDIDAFRLLREADGRLFNTLNETYSWPADESEWTRLNKLHIAFILGFGGLYPAKATVEAVLAPQEGEQKRILDLGTGTGIWAIDMAKRFPHSVVIGIDIAPVPTDSASVPLNCHFEIDDIQLGLAHFHQPPNQFDLIHARIVAMGLTNFRKTLNDIACCLKSGGMLIWIERDYDAWFTSDALIPREIGSEANPNGTWIGRFVFEAMRASSTVCRSDYAGMADGLDRGFWNQPVMDPESCKAASLYLPLAPRIHHTDHFLSHRLKYIGTLMNQDIRELHGGMRVILTKAGWPLDTIAEWQRRSEEELASTGPPMLSRFRVAWGRRRHQPASHMGFSSIPLPGTSPSILAPTSATVSISIPSQVARTQDGERNQEEKDTDPFSGSFPYPYLYVYENEAQALEEYALRQRSKEVFSFPASPVSS